MPHYTKADRRMECSVQNTERSQRWDLARLRHPPPGHSVYFKSMTLVRWLVSVCFSLIPKEWCLFQHQLSVQQLNSILTLTTQSQHRPHRSRAQSYSIASTSDANSLHLDLGTGYMGICTCTFRFVQLSMSKLHVNLTKIFFTCKIGFIWIPVASFARYVTY